MRWSEVPLSELAASSPAAIAIGPFGSSMTAETYTESGMKVVRGQDIGSGRDLEFKEQVFVGEETVIRLRRSVVRQGDLVLPHRGAIGRVGIVGSEDLMLSTSMMKITLDPRVCIPEFYLYYLRGPGKQKLLEHASVVGTPGIAQPLSALRSIRVPKPPLEIQRAIAEVLGALDDKIAANQAVALATDDLRRAQYDALLGETSQPLSLLASFVNGRAYTKNATGTGRVVIRIAELNSGLGGSTVYNDIEVPDDNVARPGDLLFAWSGSLTAARWYRPEAIVNQHIFKVIPRSGWPLWAVASAVHRKLDDFKAIAADKATTMGHIQRHHLDEPVLVPSPEQLTRHDVAMKGLWERALAAEVESLELATLRDTLLPHLMSGSLTVRDAEKDVEQSL